MKCSCAARALVLCSLASSELMRMADCSGCYDHLVQEPVKEEIVPPRRIRVASYNCLSLRAPDRLTDVLQGMRGCQVIGMQGTRVPQHGTPVQQSRLQGFHHFDSGYHPASNKHAGVSLSFSCRFFAPSDFYAFAFPEEPCLAGRLLSVR
eukprot:9286935-Alexandrium_andersonii.AAC.1